jgi:FkbM family methyltransferase
MNFKFFYGIPDHKREVTEICFLHLLEHDIITIPEGDVKRSSYFEDHLVMIEKKVYILLLEEEEEKKAWEYGPAYTIKINIKDMTVHATSEEEIDEKLNKIHQQLQLSYGSFQEELPEQKMVVRYLTGQEKVLEIGSNIGRNSLVIASIVKNDNFLTLESDANIAKQLEENKNLNQFTFHIENCALSKRKLIQNGWVTKPSDVLEEGYHQWVPIKSLEELQFQYNIEFDTLILDCEGAFYYILMDMPEILTKIQLIIMENDYNFIEHKEFVDSVLKKYNFYRDYSEGGGWGCCHDYFFEVWKKAPNKEIKK